MDNCEKLTLLPYQEKMDFLKSKRLYYGCLKFGHQRKNCRNKATSLHCRGRHPSVCHLEGKVPRLEQSTNVDKDKCVKSASVNFAKSVNADMRAGEPDCTMAIDPVTVKMTNGLKVIETYAFLDPGSSASFCTESMLRQVGGSGKPLKITLDTLGTPYTMQTYAVKNLEVGDLNMTNYIKLSKVYTKDKMPVSVGHVPTTDDVIKWPHLQDITLPKINAEVGLLIGNDVPDEYTPIETRTGSRGSPYATKSLLGWIAWNVVRSSSSTAEASKRLTVNRTEVIAIEKMKELQHLDKHLKMSINLDYPEHVIYDKRENSQEDKMFLSKVNESIQLINGHFSINLPLTNDQVKFPNNESQAHQRLKSLKSKMAANSKFKHDYVAFMTTILEKGYAEKVPPEDKDRGDGKIWFIPNHGVYHPRKPEKIRVVFDNTATYEGVSLTSQLLQGPDLTNRLLSVLLRFCQEKIALIGDIESMFYQVQIPKKIGTAFDFCGGPTAIPATIP